GCPRTASDLSCGSMRRNCGACQPTLYGLKFGASDGKSIGDSRVEDSSEKHRKKGTARVDFFPRTIGDKWGKKSRTEKTGDKKIGAGGTFSKNRGEVGVRVATTPGAPGFLRDRKNPISRDSGDPPASERPFRLLRVSVSPW